MFRRLLIFSWLCLISVGIISGHLVKEELDEEFENFLKTHDKVYKDDHERQMRKKIFIENFLKIEEFSKNSHGNVEYGTNKFSDWTKEEKDRLTPYNPFAFEKYRLDTQGGCLTTSNATLLSNFDWRDKNIVTPVKDQGDCGSCWAFATIATVEAQIAKNTGKFLNLSEQELVDCAVNLGCNGGAPSSGLTYISIFGVSTEVMYPYKAKDEKCNASAVPADTKSHIDKWVCIDIDTDNAAYWLTRIGPITYDIWVPDSLYSYKSGVWWPGVGECEAAGITRAHAVTIVGFGTENDIPYWLIKNSWGQDWGDNGYFKMHRGDHACAIGLPHVTAVIGSY